MTESAATMQINGSLIPQADCSRIEIPHSKVELFIGVFDPKDGPTLRYPDPKSLSESSINTFFPAKFDDGETFLTKIGSEFYLGICILAPNIQTSRGPMQLVVALQSFRVSFQEKHFGFLNECRNLFQTASEFNMEPVLSLAKNLPTSVPDTADISHPISSFLSGGFVCGLFKESPHNLLTVWRARLLGKRIVIATSQTIQAVSSVGYFVSFLGLPIREVEEGLFNVELANSDSISQGDWKVAGVTHPMIDYTNFADIAILPRGEIQIKPGLGWLSKGRGELCTEIYSIISHSNDLALARRFLDETQSIIAEMKSSRPHSGQDVRRLGLSCNYRRFVRALSLEIGAEGAFEPPCC